MQMYLDIQFLKWWLEVWSQLLIFGDDVFVKLIDNANENSKSVNINWAWDYTTTDRGTATLAQNDEIDTNEGEAANAFSFKMAVKGTQVSPTEQ